MVQNSCLTEAEHESREKGIFRLSAATGVAAGDESQSTARDLQRARIPCRRTILENDEKAGQWKFITISEI
jgi:hypothetical protein